MTVEEKQLFSLDDSIQRKRKESPGGAVEMGEIVATVG